MNDVLSFLQALKIDQTRTYGVWTVTCTHPDMYRIARTDGAEFVYGGWRYDEWYGRSESVMHVMQNAARKG